MDAEEPMSETPEVYLPPALIELGEFADVTLGRGWVTEDHRDDMAW